MRRFYLAGLFTLWTLAGVSGCGSAGNDFEAGNRLLVTSITDSEDHAGPVFNAVEKTDDLGRDHAENTGDEGEGNHFPDDFETVETLLGDDIGNIALANEERLGASPGVDLQVYRVDLTYYDALGNRHSYAPTKTYNVTATVPNKGNGELEIVLVPAEMKANGLRDIFLYGTASEVDAARTWTVKADVYARDVRNDRDVHAQGQITVRFIDPNVSQVSE